MLNNFSNIVIKTAENIKENIPFVLATVLQPVGGTPCRSGFKMIVYEDGSSEGTVGGGLIEQRVRTEALDLFSTRQNKFLQFTLTTNDNTTINSKFSGILNSLSEGGDTQNSKLNMQCGGEANLFLEYYAPARTAYLFGAGHLCQSILPLLNSLDFRIVVIDNRSDYAKNSKLSLADQFICQDYLKFTAEFQPSDQDAIIIFTHAHTNDYDILLSVCQRNLNYKYLGMIASRQKAKENLAQLESEGILPEVINNIHTPIGLNIAKTTTQEIAISITAELLAVYNNIKNIKSLSRNRD